LEKETKAQKKEIKVGSDVKSKCGACKELCTHIVVSMNEKKVPLQVRCYKCGRSHLYRPETKARTAGSKKKNPDAEEWLRLSQKWDESKAGGYSMTNEYKNGSLINHKKFGIGIVRQNLGAGRMRVLFEDGLKLMCCAEG